MFGRKRATENPIAKAAREHLAAAVERNAPVGVVQLAEVGTDPLATGRLLRWSDGQIEVEDLQVIGRDLRFRSGDQITCYASIREKIVEFTAKIVQTGEMVKINGRMVVPAMTLTEPGDIQFGDRRTAYRASLSVLGGEHRADIWFMQRTNEALLSSGDDEEDEEPITREAVPPGLFTSLRRAATTPRVPGVPLLSVQGDVQDAEGAADAASVALDVESPDSETLAHAMERVMEDGPHARGVLVDVAANGLGLVMYGIQAMQLRRFEYLTVSFEWEGRQINAVLQVRRAENIAEDRCRVGGLLVYPAPGDLFSGTRRELEQINLQIQRELARRRSAG